MNEKDALEEAIRQLRDRVLELRQHTSTGNRTDRVVDAVGDACTLAGLLLLFLLPADPLSATLCVLGIAILGYNHLIRLPRTRGRERERRRQIDMLTARIDRIELDLADADADR